MTLRKTATKPRQRWALLIGAVAALTLAIAGVSLAVHDEEFQLDGNVLASVKPASMTQALDWDSFFNGSGGEKTLPNTNWKASGFDRDFSVNPGCVQTGTGSFCTADGSTYATGSKDTLPITPGWQCNFDNNVNSKIDIMNSYAASYEEGGEEILYFAMERNTNTGTANVGFWFLQDENVDCNSSSGTAAFSGNHVDGDLLVVSEFTNGGVINSIRVYEWEGGADGALNPNPVAGGTGLGVDCSSIIGGHDPVCGEVNTGTITTPWPTANKQDGVGTSLRISEFFEAGLNLTLSDLDGRCFNTFIATTRSSTSLTATIFDFSRGSLGQCTSTTVTTPKQEAPDPEDPPVNITSEPIPATGQLTVMDSALITVNGSDTFDATVTFYLCRSSELTDADPDPDVEELTCGSGGTQIGDPVAITANGTVLSESAGLTAADRYCWRAEFSGDTDTGVPPSSDSSSGECFDVEPLTPTLTTNASADVTLGDPIYDTITLTGTADTPGTNGIGPGGTIDATDRQPAGGTISVTAYGPDDSTCTEEAASEELVDWPVSITVSGDNNAYGGAGSATQFTPTAIGQYTFVASYSGDSPNTNAAGPSACDDVNEQVTVGGTAAFTTEQDWLPNDTATLTGDTNLTGDLTFTLFSNGTCDDTDPDADIYSETIEVNDAPSGTAFSTDNDSVTVSASGTFSWLVTYVDDNLADPAPSCLETTALTIDNDGPDPTP